MHNAFFYLDILLRILFSLADNFLHKNAAHILIILEREVESDRLVAPGIYLQVARSPSHRVEIEEGKL